MVALYSILLQTIGIAFIILAAVLCSEGRIKLGNTSGVLGLVIWLTGILLYIHITARGLT